MSATIAIRNWLLAIPAGRVFTTSELFGVGTRDAIDKCLSRLVKQGVIRRVARGVFSNGTEEPRITPLELAKVKARAFHKEVYEHASTTAQKLGYIPRKPRSNPPTEDTINSTQPESKQNPAPQFRSTNESLAFATSGSSSSSFQSIFGTIELKAVSARKRQTHRNEVWEMVKALWHLGKNGIEPKIERRIREVWGRKSQEALQKYCATIPQWLRERLPRNTSIAVKSIMANIAESRARESDTGCWCPDKKDCICPAFSCEYCQSAPVWNRFSMVLG